MIRKIACFSFVAVLAIASLVYAQATTTPSPTATTLKGTVTKVDSEGKKITISVKGTDKDDTRVLSFSEDTVLIEMDKELSMDQLKVGDSVTVETDDTNRILKISLDKKG